MLRGRPGRFSPSGANPVTIKSMTTQTETENRKDAAESESRADALDWAVFGCLAAGAVGIIKALSMDKALDILVCLLGSIAAFSVIFYVHLRKR